MSWALRANAASMITPPIAGRMPFRNRSRTDVVSRPAEVPDARQTGDTVVEGDQQADRQDGVAEEVAPRPCASTASRTAAATPKNTVPKAGVGDVG